MKNLSILIIIAISILYSCDSSESVKTETIKENPYAYYDSISTDIKGLVSNVQNNKLVIGDSSVQGNKTSFTYDKVSGNRIFTIKNNTLNNIHYDFYYDSLDNNLNRDVDSLVTYFTREIDPNPSLYFSESMTTYSWIINNMMFDFEVFSNGYSVTVRSLVSNEEIKEAMENKTFSFNPEHLEKTTALIDLIDQKKIVIGSTNVKDMNSILSDNLKLKGYTASFSKHYGEDLLLSVTFEEKKDLITAVYFDYMYANPDKEEIFAASDSIRHYINKKFDLPTDVATTKMSNSYKWNIAPPLLLEVYSDGYSIIWEEKAL